MEQRLKYNYNMTEKAINLTLQVYRFLLLFTVSYLHQTFVAVV